MLPCSTGVLPGAPFDSVTPGKFADLVVLEHQFIIRWKDDYGDGRPWLITCPCGEMSRTATDGELPHLMRLHLEAIAHFGRKGGT